MEHIIHIAVQGKIATQTDRTVYICGNSDYVLEFSFDEEWAATPVKTARLIDDDEHYHDVVFNGNVCPVPVLSDTFRIRVGVFAGDLQTTTPAYVPAKKSILCAGGSPAAPADDVYAQIMDKLNGTANEAKEAFYGALEEAKESGEFDGPQGIQGERGETGAAGPVGPVGPAGADGFSPSLKLERVTDGVQVTATNEDGEQTETVWDGSKDVFVVRVTLDDSYRYVSDKTPGEIENAAKSLKAVIALNKHEKCVYSYIGLQTGRDNSSIKKHSFVFVGVTNNITPFAKYLQINDDSTVKAYNWTTVKAMNPFSLKFTGAIEAEYDGSEAVTVEIPAGGGAECDVFVVNVDMAEKKADKTAAEIKEAREAGKVCLAHATGSAFDHVIYMSTTPSFNPVMSRNGDETFERYSLKTSNTGLTHDLMWIDSEGNVSHRGYPYNNLSLTFTGAVNATYNGKEAVTVNIPEGGIGPAGPAGADGKDGADGAPGKDGADGFSPTVTLERLDDGVKITTTDKNGTQSEIVYDGKDGKDGAGGAVGYVLPETTAIMLDGNELLVTTEPFEADLIIGKTYTVTWNGVEYECECWPFVEDDGLMPLSALGNTYMVDGVLGEQPFMIVQVPTGTEDMEGVSALVLPLDESTSPTLSIFGEIGSSDNRYIVNITETDDGELTANHLAPEIWAAHRAGKEIEVHFDQGGTGALILHPLILNEGACIFTAAGPIDDSGETNRGTAVQITIGNSGVSMNQIALLSDGDGERIDERLDSLSEDKADKPKPYVLIDSIEVGEGDEIKGYSCTQKLRDFELTIEVPAASETSAGGIEAYKGNRKFAGYIYASQIIYTQNILAVANSAVVAGNSVVEWVYSQHFGAESSKTQTKQMLRSAFLTDVNDPYTAISLYASKAFPAGTKIIMRGVLADA